MKKLTKKTLVSFILTVFVTITMWGNLVTSPKISPNIQPEFIEQNVKTTENDSVRTKFIQEIDSFIQVTFPSSKLTGIHIADACLEHEFDPCFLLAQGIIESGLGTAGKAKHTGSPWNVGQYDGRSVQEMRRLGLTHNDPNNAIEPYIILVKTKYMGSKRTYDDLMRNYVTLSGYRYASSRSYERALKTTYERIKSRTSIYNLYTQLIKG